MTRTRRVLEPAAKVAAIGAVGAGAVFLGGQAAGSALRAVTPPLAEAARTVPEALGTGAGAGAANLARGIGAGTQDLLLPIIIIAAIVFLTRK